MKGSGREIYGPDVDEWGCVERPWREMISQFDVVIFLPFIKVSSRQLGRWWLFLTEVLSKASSLIFLGRAACSPLYPLTISDHAMCALIVRIDNYGGERIPKYVAPPKHHQSTFVLGDSSRRVHAPEPCTLMRD